jgi:hypothetical protein
LGAGPDDADDIKRHAFFKDVNWDDMLHKRVPPPFYPSIVRRARTHRDTCVLRPITVVGDGHFQLRQRVHWRAADVDAGAHHLEFSGPSRYAPLGLSSFVELKPAA